MSDWSHGYNVSLGYTYGFYREMTPDWMDMCTRAAGYVAPKRGADGAFRYLELGSGQGFGLCILAASNPDGEFVGIDFNPEHIAHSQELADAAGLTNIRFVEGDFSELGVHWPAEFGQFDYAALHGICSWVPQPVRVGIVGCLDKALKPGALVYNSYNTQPGWISSQPFQHIARRLQVVGALEGPKALDEALGLFDNLKENKAGIFNALPMLNKRLDSVRTQNRNYLVQEYLHENWSLFWFSQMMREMEGAKLGFIGSATIAEQMLPGLLPEKMRAPIDAQTDPIFKQEVIDLTINQTFRRDLMCRGARRSFSRNADGVGATVLHLVGAPKTDEPLLVMTSYGEITIKQENFVPVVEALREGPMTVSELLRIPAISQKKPNLALQNIMLLAQNSVVSTGRTTPVDSSVAQRFNMVVAAAASRGAPYSQIAAPALGSALALGDVDMIMLHHWFQAPESTPDALGEALLRTLAILGRGMQHEGKALSGEPLQRRAVELARVFSETTLPRLRTFNAVA